MHTQIVWFEVVGTDAAALQRFYGEVLGWQFQPAPGDEVYGLVAPDGRPVGGVGTVPEGTWNAFYVAVPNLEDAIARALQAGGTLRMARKDFPGMAFAVVADPEGHALGLAQRLAA